MTPLQGAKGTKSNYPAYMPRPITWDGSHAHEEVDNSVYMLVILTNKVDFEEFLCNH